MNSILGTISSEQCSNRSRGLCFSIRSISGSNELSPILNSVITYKFHADANITGHKCLEVTEEGLSNVLAIEYINSLLCELRHLQSIDLETLSLNGINDFANVLV